MTGSVGHYPPRNTGTSLSSSSPSPYAPYALPTYPSEPFPVRRRGLSNPQRPPLPTNWEFGTFDDFVSGSAGAEATATAASSTSATAMSSTLLPPGESAAKRYSTMFRSSRLWAAGNNEDITTPNFFNDLAFLDETGGLATSSLKLSKASKLLPLRKPKEKEKEREKEKTHASKGSTSSFLKKSGVKRTASFRKRTASPTSFVTEQDDQTIDLADSIREDSDEEPMAETASLPSSDSEAGGLGFFSDLAFLEAQEEVVVKPAKPKAKQGTKSSIVKNTTSKLKSNKGSSSPKSSASSTFTRFRTGSSQASVRSRTSSLHSMSTGTTVPSAPSLAARRVSQTPSQNSGVNPPSSPPSLATHSSSPSLSSTMIPSPSAPSRGSMLFQSPAKDLPALPVDFGLGLPDGVTPRAATFGRSYDPGSPQPSARYLFDSPTPQPPVKLFEQSAPKPSFEPASPIPPAKDLSPTSPPMHLTSSPQQPPAQLQYDGPTHPLFHPHGRQHSAGPHSSVGEPGAHHPPRHSSLNATSSSAPAVHPALQRSNRASLSAILARDERERSASIEARRNARPQGINGPSAVSPSAEDVALLPGFNRLALSPPVVSNVRGTPMTLAPPPSWGRRRNMRTSVLSVDGGPTSPCLSLIAAFPTPPEGQETEDMMDDPHASMYSHSHSLSQTLAELHAQLWPHMSGSASNEPRHSQSHPHARVQRIDTSVRPESDAFSFDDDYWLATPSVHHRTPDTASSHDTMTPGRRPLSLPRVPDGHNVATSPTSPALLTPDLAYPDLAPSSPPMHDDSDAGKTKTESSTEGRTFDINSLIEAARPESATLPEFVNFDRESLRSQRSTMQVQASEDGSHAFEHDLEEVLTNDECHDSYTDTDSVSDCFELESPTAWIREECAERGPRASESSDQHEIRSSSPTSEAARMDALLALESLASSAGYRLVRESYMAPPADTDSDTARSVTPTTSTPARPL